MAGTKGYNISKLITDEDLGRFRKLLGSYKSAIKSNIKAEGKWTTGTCWGTLYTKEYISSDTLVLGIDSSNPILIQQLENGRKSGKRPPIESIYNWTLNKGISFPNDKERLRASWAISNKIAKNGTNQFIKGKNPNIFSNLYDKYQQKIASAASKCISSKLNIILNDALKP